MDTSFSLSINKRADSINCVDFRGQIGKLSRWVVVIIYKITKHSYTTRSRVIYRSLRSGCACGSCPLQLLDSFVWAVHIDIVCSWSIGAQLEGSRQTPRPVIVAVCSYYGASMNLPRALLLFEPKNWRCVGGGHDFLQLTRHNYVIIHLAVHEWADAWKPWVHILVTLMIIWFTLFLQENTCPRYLTS